MVLGGLAWDRALVIATAVLIITCPCALALAVPVVQVVASTRLMKSGVLLLSPTALERLAGVDHVVLDKTGTLTVGRPELQSGGDSEDLAFAAGMAANSRHPLAKALLRAMPHAPVLEHVFEHPGHGLEAGAAKLGSAAFCGVKTASEDGLSEFWLTRPGRQPVRFAFADRLRPDAREVIGDFQRLGLTVELLSGDHPAAASAAASEAGILQVQGGVNPADKVTRLRALADAGKKVLMVGDGLNDAPALAAAYVSMSPASAAEATQNAADAVFQGDALKPVVEAISVSRHAGRLVRQNLSLALAYNLAAVPLAIAGAVTPLIAAIAMSSSSLLVIVNALRLGARHGRAR
jgi:Cu2+-exporting ATPase